MEIYCMAFLLQFFKKNFFFNIISPEELYVLDQSSSLITKASRLGSKQAQAPILTGQAFGGEGRAESHSPVDRGGWQWLLVPNSTTTTSQKQWNISAVLWFDLND